MLITDTVSNICTLKLKWVLKSIAIQPMIKGCFIHITKVTSYFNKTNNNKGLYSTEKNFSLDAFFNFRCFI